MTSRERFVSNRTVLIGHRGTGKTSLLKRIESYFQHDGEFVQCIDLDREIERRTGRSIHAVFEADGEEAFRRLEYSTFGDIQKEVESSSREVFLAVGAGFDPDLIPTLWHAIWVRRPTDAGGRIFTDRPRLDSTAPALEEFMVRYHRRQTGYAARADETLWLDEGIESPDEAEAGFFLRDFRGLDGAITLLPHHFESNQGQAEARLGSWIETRIGWGVRWIELRDDLLTTDQMELALKYLPDDRALMSFRALDRAEATARLISHHGLAFDWPIERGACPYGDPRFLSLHERLPNQSIGDALLRFPREIPEGAQLKAAVPIYSFKELAEAHAWRKAFPEARIFLPLSQDGRWSWYRLWLGARAGLNFFREAEGSGADQPTLLQWARTRRLEDDPRSGEPHINVAHLFAAVLGDPVSHSRTPIEHASFFAAGAVPVFAIRVTAEEWQNDALSFLRSLGLRWAAVTAPLKNLAFDSCSRHDKVSLKLQSVNTMRWNEEHNEWLGHNTDLEGLVEALKEETNDLGRIGVWGGGGTLNVIKAALPQAELFSLRTLENRRHDGPSASEFTPDTVVWAVGRSRVETNQPPENWKPRLVIDLNYSDDSPGREYALANGSRYLSGLKMFRAQAEAQRRLWSVP